MRIHRLTETVVNQIAAGEVIERPASVVKELLENALDAGATRIRIELQHGGKSLIQITDNGHGIHPDDMRLAITGHATSKLADIDDLQTISSLGFRGEALASINSVAVCTISSKTASLDAYRLSISDGQVQCQPTNHAQGTTVTVRDLFYNTPARRKFLRQDNIELAHCETAIKRIMVGRPDCQLECYHGEKKVLSFKRFESNCLERLRPLLGKQFTDHASVIDARATGVSLIGYISNPEYSRSQNDGQYFYLNNRFIKDRLVSHAINSVYQALLYHGRQAGYVLFMSVDPSEFDINVHPTKHEVRFQQPRYIHEFIVSSCQAALTQTPLAMPIKADVLEDEVRETQEPALSPSLPAKLIGECHDHLAVLSDQDELTIVNYLRLKRYFTQHTLQREHQNRALHATPLLIPVQTSADPVQIECLQEQQERLSSLGIEINVLLQQVVLRGLPIALRGINPQQGLSTLISFLTHHRFSSAEDELRLFSELSRCIDSVDGSEKSKLLQHYFELPAGVRAQLSRQLPLSELVTDE